MKDKKEPPPNQPPETAFSHEYPRYKVERAARPSDVIGDDLLEYFRKHRWAVFVLGGLGLSGLTALFLWVAVRLKNL